MTVYNKLVRDRIPERIRARGGHPVTRIAVRDELRGLLHDKLREEVSEFIAAGGREAQREELADVLEVVRALTRMLGMTAHELESIRSSKHRSHGGFTAGIVLIES